MGLRNRLRRLERSGRLPCSECGHYDDDEQQKVKLTLGSESDSEEDTSEEEGPKYCPRCGRLCGGRIKLTWD